MERRLDTTTLFFPLKGFANLHQKGRGQVNTTVTEHSLPQVTGPSIRHNTYQSEKNTSTAGNKT